jgi:hypothetical protein
MNRETVEQQFKENNPNPNKALFLRAEALGESLDIHDINALMDSAQAYADYYNTNTDEVLFKIVEVKGDSLNDEEIAQLLNLAKGVDEVAYKIIDVMGENLDESCIECIFAECGITKPLLKKLIGRLVALSEE